MVSAVVGSTSLSTDPGLSRAIAVVGAHAGDSDFQLFVLVGLSTMGSLALLGIGSVALRRRRSRSYLLIVGALVALVLRPLTVSGVVFGMLSEPQHHFLEHAFDVCIAACLLAAIYGVPTPEAETDSVR